MVWDFQVVKKWWVMHSLLHVNAAVPCKNCQERSTQFLRYIAFLKSQKKKTNLELSGSVLSWCFFAPLGVLWVMKTSSDSERSLYCHVLRVVLYLHTESTDCRIRWQLEKKIECIVHASVFRNYLAYSSAVAVGLMTASLCSAPCSHSTCMCTDIMTSTCVSWFPCNAGYLVSLLTLID